MADKQTRAELEQCRIATLERCPICDRPNGDEIHENLCDDCDDVCWTAMDGGETDDCRAHAVDWRARALAAEARVVALIDAARQPSS